MSDYGHRIILGTNVRIVSKKLLVLRRSAATDLPLANPPAFERTCVRIVCCISGSAKHFIDGKALWVHKGDILIIPTDSEYRLIQVKDNSYDEISLILFPTYFNALTTIHPDMIRSMQSRQKEGRYLFRPTGKGPDNFIQAFETIHREYTTCLPGWEMIAYSTAACILAWVFRPVHMEPSSAVIMDNEKLMQHILTYIDEHYSEPLSLDNIAKHFSIGSSKLSKLFLQYESVSCYQYIIRRRLAAAQVYLLEGIPAKQVCILCGFPDYPSFYRHYKKNYGISPSKFMADVYKSAKR